MKVQCETEKGGSVQLNNDHGVWASYAVAGVAGLPPPEILYAGVTLPNGRQVQFFLNRESGLVVVDVVAPHNRGGNEVLRLNANMVGMASVAECNTGRRKLCHSTG
jgi:hypothetical protein